MSIFAVLQAVDDNLSYEKYRYRVSQHTYITELPESFYDSVVALIVLNQ